MTSRRDLILDGAKWAGLAALGDLVPPSIQRALAIQADRRTGTIQDVRLS
jgi:phospholipase C